MVVTERDTEGTEAYMQDFQVARKNYGMRVRGAKAHRPAGDDEHDDEGGDRRAPAQERLGAERRQHCEDRDEGDEKAMECEGVATEEHHPGDVEEDEQEPRRGNDLCAPPSATRASPKSHPPLRTNCHTYHVPCTSCTPAFA